MRPPISNPGDREKDEWFTCPSCHAFMMPLSKYEIQKVSASPTVGAEWWEFLLFGWMAFVYNYLYDAFTYEERKAKVNKLRTAVLPQFPNSQICPQCLHVLKRP